MLRIYIMGPMSGHPDHNRDAFYCAADMIEERGFIPINPHEYEEPGMPDEPQDRMYRRVMPGDIERLSTCDYVLALPGWETSKGSALESHAADLMGIDVLTLDDDTTEYRGPLSDYIDYLLDLITAYRWGQANAWEEG